VAPGSYHYWLQGLSNDVDLQDCDNVIRWHSGSPNVRAEAVGLARTKSCYIIEIERSAFPCYFLLYKMPDPIRQPQSYEAPDRNQKKQACDNTFGDKSETCE
jgi:hypothetical protein